MDLPTTRHDNPATSAQPKSAAVSSGSFSRFNFSSAPSYLLLVAAFLAPLAFLPSAYAPLDMVKMVVLSVCILVAGIIYVVGTLKNKTFTLPRSNVSYALIAVAASVIISSLASANFFKSFIGQGFEVGTASFMLLMLLATFLVTRIVAKDKQMVFKVYTALLAAFVLLALIFIIRLALGPGVLSLGFLSSLTSTFVGKWYDLAGVAAVVALLSYFGMRFLAIGKGIKRILFVVLLMAGAMLFIINFSLAWYALALTLLCVGIYEYSRKNSDATGVKKVFARLPLTTLILFIIAITCAWKGNVIAGPVAASLNAQYGEAVLPWQLTLDVTSDTLKESPILGAGPNRFGSQYLRFKPLEVNQTQFWNVDFVSGFGNIPTTFATLGLLGLIVWCIFFITFIKEGVRSLRKAIDPTATFLTASSFFIAVFLWIINIIYVPSHVIIFLTFMVTGVFIALTLENKEVGKVFHKAKLIPILSTILLVVLIVWLGVYVKKTVAISYFQKGIKELSTGASVDTAHKHFAQALAWDSLDIYYQALSEVNILKISALAQELQAASTKNPSAPIDQKKVDTIMTLTNEAVEYAKKAQALDPYNHFNYISEARISEIAASFKIPNAYENAKTSYANALRVNPFNPGIYLNYARLEASQNKFNEAQQAIGRAIQLKQNYTEAVYLLSQIQVANNQLKDAITSARVATQITPTEPILFFQLGILQYNEKDYTSAATSLEKAISLNPEYANAKYFLGLSYARLGKNAAAITQFEELAKANPDNKEIALILSNLKQGKSPFSDAKPPIDNTPEKRKTLPVTEKQTTQTAAPKTVKK